MSTGFDAGNEILLSIRKIVHVMEMHSKKLKAGFGITTPQFLIMTEINKSPNITTMLLKDKVSLSQSTVTNILDRLEERQLISKVRDTRDKRKWFLSLTVAGSNMINSRPNIFRRKFVDDFGCLPDEQKSQIINSLQHLAAMLE